MKIPKKCILLILLSLMVASCNISPDSITQQTIAVATDKAIVTVIPSQTSYLIAPIPSQLPINTPPPAITRTQPSVTSTSRPSLPGIEVKLIEVITSSVETIRVKGLLAYLDYSDSKNYLLNLSTEEKTLLYKRNPQNLYCGSVSPNHHLLACQADDQLFLFDRQAQMLGSYSWQKEWFSIAGWVNNTLLAFATRPPQDYSNLLNAPTTLLDIATKQIELVIPDYPNITIFEPFGNLGPLASTGVSYSPDLELVIYEAYEAGDYTWVLWDRKAQQEKARIPQGEQWPYPQWSPDGQQVVIAGSEVSYTQKQSDTEIYILSRLNGVQQLTHLGDLFLNLTEIWGLGWSPDGKKIAFLLQSSQSACSPGGCIGIIDIATEKLEFFRFHQYWISFPLEPTYRLTWSPDSQHLLLSLSSEVTLSSSIVVFDIAAETAFPVIPSEVRILGWMSEPAP